MSTADSPSVAPVVRWWIPLIEFLVHTFVGTTIFVVVFVPAVLLNLLVHWLQTKQISPWLGQVLLAGEIMLLGTDIILYAIFLVKTGRRAAKAF